MIASNLTFFGDCKVDLSSTCDSIWGLVESFYKQLCVSVGDFNLSRRPLWRRMKSIGWEKSTEGDLQSEENVKWESRRRGLHSRVWGRLIYIIDSNRMNSCEIQHLNVWVKQNYKIYRVTEHVVYFHKIIKFPGSLGMWETGQSSREVKWLYRGLLAN